MCCEYLRKEENESMSINVSWKKNFNRKKKNRTMKIDVLTLFSSGIETCSFDVIGILKKFLYMQTHNESARKF
jgi:hypothetical protein